ncbi:MAG: hypothetical protein SNJ49_15215, partial [Chloracidobacterium sp.]
RERLNRTRFAQRGIKPVEVTSELDAVDEAIGSQSDLASFVREACKRLNLPIKTNPRNGVDEINLASAEGEYLRYQFGDELTQKKSQGLLRISFTSPPPPNTLFIHRTHPFVSSLTQLVWSKTMGDSQATDAIHRCGCIASSDVMELTTLYLLRIRYLVTQPGAADTLAEEVLVGAMAKDDELLSLDAARRLFLTVQPAHMIELDEKKRLVEKALQSMTVFAKPESAVSGRLEKVWNAMLRQRALTIQQSHRRLRKAMGQHVRDLTITPILPPDVLGLLVIQPVSGEGV